jgi:predicted dehydrogenase
VGGGRIVGEACHFLDLARFLVGSPITRTSVVTAHDATGAPIDDVSHLSMGFADGSTAVVHYLATGARDFPKERIESFADGRTLVIENWRRLLEYGGAPRWFTPSRRPDKGHAAELREWASAIRAGGAPPIPLDELLEVSAWAVRAGEAARDGGGVITDPWEGGT